MKPQYMADMLLAKYKIYMDVIDGANEHGCRIILNIYTTTTRELDFFVSACKEMSTLKG